MCASNSRGEGDGTRPTDIYLYFLNLISNIMWKELSYSISPPNNHPQPILMIILSFMIKMTFTFCFENLCFYESQYTKIKNQIYKVVLSNFPSADIKIIFELAKSYFSFKRNSRHRLQVR